MWFVALSIFPLQDFLHKLVPVFSEAEDLESTPDLHMMCMLLHSISKRSQCLPWPHTDRRALFLLTKNACTFPVNLNDHSLWDFILSDEIFLDLVSILECEWMQCR